MRGRYGTFAVAHPRPEGFEPLTPKENAMGMKPMWVCEECGTEANVFGRCPFGPHRKDEKPIVHPPLVLVNPTRRKPRKEKA